MITFQKVSLNLVPQIKEVLKNDVPGSIVPLQMVDMYIKSKRLYPELEVNLYTPGGVVDKHGTFLLYVPEHRGNFVVHSTNSDLEDIKQAILDLEDIQWDELLSMGPVHIKFHSILHDIYKVKGLPQDNCQYAENLAMTKQEALQLTVNVPEGLELRQLDTKYSQFINKHWPHGGPKAIHYVDATLKINGGVGLFEKGSEDMISWGVYSMIGGVGMIQTLETHRGKGYADVVGKALTRIVAENGYDPHLQINIGLTGSKKLFTRMGYSVTHEVTWHLFNNK